MPNAKDEEGSASQKMPKKIGSEIGTPPSRRGPVGRPACRSPQGCGPRGWMG
jgi:hypothetical protein